MWTEYEGKLADELKFLAPDKGSRSSSRVLIKRGKSTHHPRMQVGSVKDDVWHRTPWGVGLFEGGVKERMNMDVTLTDPALEQFWVSVDDAILDKAEEQSMAWFGTQHTRQELERMHCRMVKKNKTGDYPARLRTKVNVKYVNVDRLTKDEASGGYVKETQLQWTEVTANSLVVVVLELYSVYFMNSQFGGTVNVKTIVLSADGGERESDVDYGDVKVVRKRKSPSEDTQQQQHGEPTVTLQSTSSSSAGPAGPSALLGTGTVKHVRVK